MRQIGCHRGMSRFLVAVAGVGTCALAAGAPQDAPARGEGAPRTYRYVELNSESAAAAWNVNDSGRVAGVTSSRAVFWMEAQLFDIGAPGLSAAYGINSLGGIVGQTTVESREPPHAFLYRDGVVSDLGTGFGSGSFSRGWAINDAGDIVGERGPRQLAPSQAFLFRNGEFIDLGTLGGDQAIAYDINDFGQIVGSSRSEVIWTHAFLYQDGVMIDLGTLGDPYRQSEARSINNLGQIVGSSRVAFGSDLHAVRWDGGEILDLGVLGSGNASGATSINDGGQIVGYSRLSTDIYVLRAFLWESGQMFNLNDLVDPPLPANIQLENARAISNNGIIVGYTCNPLSPSACPPGAPATRAFMLIPNF